MSGPSRQTALRHIPSVDRVLAHDAVQELLARHPRRSVVRAVRETLDALRRRLRVGAEDDASAAAPGPEAIAAEVARLAAELDRPSVRRVLNATGVILHTGLGRAVLSEPARRAMAEAAGPSLVEVDPDSGERTVRTRVLEPLLQELTGAEAATVVNNNAAATMLILNTVAEGREVIVSRGQLVEIGGSFRMPDVMTKSGAVLVDVGTTNRTHLRDYAEAIGENTAALFRAHTSNFKVVGFTKSVPIEELAKLGRDQDVPVIDDVGSGALIDLGRFGFPDEPVVRKSIEAGADLVCFSGDKLIGGPQAGFIVGRRDWVRRIEKNPLARAFRIDKSTLAGIEATLRLFLDEQRLLEMHPTLRMITTPLEQIERSAAVLARELRDAAPHLEVRLLDASSQIGSGSLPTENLPTRAVGVRAPDRSPDNLARALRRGVPSVFARVQHDELLFDPRTLAPEEGRLVAVALREALDRTRNDGAPPPAD